MLPNAPDASPRELIVPRFPQPDDVTCGPSALLSVLCYHGYRGSFEELKPLIPTNPDGGTLAVYLGLSALRLGYPARLYSYNLRVIDPTWSELAPEVVASKLRARAAKTPRKKLRAACEAYADFLAAGGVLDFRDLEPELLIEAVDRGRPLICGLNATYLYGDARERPENNVVDDVHGDSVGHFLVVSGHDGGRQLLVTDPAEDAPHTASEGETTSEGDTYAVSARRLINAILLGIISFDAVLLEISPESN